MKHHDFAPRLFALHEEAVVRFGAGRRPADAMFDDAEKAWLAQFGVTAQHLFDYAEDQHNYGEPGAAQAVAIECVRRDYFLHIQKGKPSSRVLEVAKMPAKTDAVDGISWLPRLIPKTKAKLRGELPPELMYCCGGDRKFFQEHDIAPDEFLRVVWSHEDDDAAIVAWVKARRSA